LSPSARGFAVAFVAYFFGSVMLYSGPRKLDHQLSYTGGSEKGNNDGR
jgi:hypothetical protein